MESRITAKGWGEVKEGGLSKKEKGLMDKDNSVNIARGDIRGLNGMENIIEIKF